MDDICKSIEEYKQRKILIKEFCQIITELFVRGRKLVIFFLLHNLILLYQKTLNKFYTLSYCEKSKQTRASTNRIK